MNRLSNISFPNTIEIGPELSDMPNSSRWSQEDLLPLPMVNSMPESPQVMLRHLLTAKQQLPLAPLLLEPLNRLLDLQLTIMQLMANLDLVLLVNLDLLDLLVSRDSVLLVNKVLEVKVRLVSVPSQANKAMVLQQVSKDSVLKDSKVLVLKAKLVLDLKDSKDNRLLVFKDNRDSVLKDSKVLVLKAKLVLVLKDSKDNRLLVLKASKDSELKDNKDSELKASQVFKVKDLEASHRIDK